MKMIKVKNIENINNKIVCKGKLLLVETNQSPTNVGEFCKHTNNGYCIIKDEKHLEFAFDNNYKISKPIIISETEEIIEMGEFRYCTYWYDKIDTQESTAEDIYKILSLPEHFSPEILNQIIEGRLKDGDEVYLECTDWKDGCKGYYGYGKHGCHNPCKCDLNTYIKLNQQNYINIIPIKKEETIDNYLPIEFIKWYSGMNNKQILEAYENWKKNVYLLCGWD